MGLIVTVLLLILIAAVLMPSATDAHIHRFRTRVKWIFLFWLCGMGVIFLLGFLNIIH